MSTTNYLWISVVGNVVAVVLIPFVGNLSDRIGRRPVIIVGCAGLRAAGVTRTCTSSARTTWPWRSSSPILMWGVVYQGYNAVFPAFYQELFPTRTRVTAFAVSQNIGTLITAFLPTIYAAIVGPTPAACVVEKEFQPDVVLPTGETCRTAADAIEAEVVWMVGSFTFGLAIIAAIAAYSARETFRIHLNDLGKKDAVPVPREEYERIRRTGLDTPV